MQRVLHLYDWCVSSPEELKIPAGSIPDFNRSRAPFVLAAESLYGDELPKEWKMAAEALRG